MTSRPKSSPNYHMWLTPEQFGQQFGPADADIQAVTDWLTVAGLSHQSGGGGPHGDRVFGHGGGGAPGTSHGDPQIRGERRGALGQRERPADSRRAPTGGGWLCLAEQFPPATDDSAPGRLFAHRKPQVW